MRGLVKVILRHPALTFVLIGLALGQFSRLADAAYDSGGMKGVLFWTAEFFCLPFFTVGQFLFSKSGVAVKGYGVIRIIGGLILCLLFDFVLRELVRWRRRVKARRAGGVQH